MAEHQELEQQTTHAVHTLGAPSTPSSHGEDPPDGGPGFLHFHAGMVQDALGDGRAFLQHVKLEPLAGDAVKALGDDLDQMPGDASPQARLEKLESAAAKQKQDVLAKTEAVTEEADQAGDAAVGQVAKVGDDKQTQVDAQQLQPAQHQTKPAAPAAPVQTEREKVEQKLEQGFQTQQAKLDQDRDQAKAKISTDFGAQLKKLEEEQASEDAKIAAEQSKQVGTVDTQIAGKKGKYDADQVEATKILDDKATDEAGPILKQAEDEAASLRATAKAEAERIDTTAKTQADGVRTAAQKEATNARTTGGSQATAAKDAANDRAGSMKDAGNPAESKKEEREGVTATGQQRAAQANEMGEQRAKDILAKAEVQAKDIEAKARVARDKAIADGETRAKAALERGKASAEKVRAKAKDGSGNLAKTSGAGVAKMEGEKMQLTAELAGQRAGAGQKMTAARADAQAKLDAEEAAAVAKIEKQHADATAKLKAKLEEDRKKLAGTNDKNLGAMSKQIDGDVKAMERQVAATKKSIELEVAHAEGKAKMEVAQKQREIRAEGKKAVAAIDGAVAAAKKKIEAHDKATKEELVTVGVKAVEDVEAAASATKQAQANATAADAKAIADDADVARKAAEKQGADGARELATMASDVKADIEKKWVDDATAKAHEKLVDEFITDDEEATEAMNALASLPKDARTKAMGQLDDETFEELIDQVPEERREDFDKLVEATPANKPERKLALYREQAKSQAQNDERRDEEETPTWCWEDDHGAGARNDWRERRREGTEKEIDEETAILEAKQKAGTLTDADVQTLIDTKNKEREIERKYGVNITQTYDDKGKNHVWTKAELESLDKGLKAVPKDHLVGLEEIRRTDDGTGGANYQPDKIIRVNKLQGGTFPHELGHHVDAQRESEAAKKYKEAAGWKDFSGRDDLKNHLTEAPPKGQGLSAADAETKLQAMEAEAGTGDIDRNGVTINGRVYRMGQKTSGTGGFTSYDVAGMPELGETEKQGEGWRDDWVYARSKSSDDFADAYKLAVRDPVRLNSDLVDRPQAKLDQAEAAVAALKASGVPDTDPAYVSAIADRDKAKLKRDTLKTKFDVMREEVMGVDQKAVDAQAAALDTSKVSPADVAAFREQAKRCTTPDQLETLRDTYNAGKQVNTASIDSAVASGDIPAGQEAAFRADAARCFTPAQLDQMRQRYKSGDRKNGEWNMASNLETPYMGY